MTQRERTTKALNIVAKWCKLFAGWQLGTRTDTDPEAAAVRDHREVTILTCHPQLSDHLRQGGTPDSWRNETTRNP